MGGRGTPISADTARRILVYDRAVFERFERRIRRLPKRGAFEDRGIGHLSYFATLVHVLNVHEAWLVYVVPGRTAEFVRTHAEPRRHPSDWAGFRRYSSEVWQGLERFAEQATDRSLARRVQAPWMPGRYTVGDAVLQTSFEEAHHLGELIGALWQQDRRSPDMTWIDVGRGGPRR